MKINKNYIKAVIILFLVVFLYSFTNQRNEERSIIKKIDVEFADDDVLFISRESVNKLLIQNNENVTGVAKEKVVLKESQFIMNAVMPRFVFLRFGFPINHPFIALKA